MLSQTEFKKLALSAEVKMPAGKYKGASIEDVPNGYLLWLQDNLPEDKSEKFLNEIQKELTYREKFNIILE